VFLIPDKGLSLTTDINDYKLMNFKNEVYVAEKGPLPLARNLDYGQSASRWEAWFVVADNGFQMSLGLRSDRASAATLLCHAVYALHF